MEIVITNPWAIWAGVAVIVWWTFAVIFFVGLNYEGGKPKENVTIAIFWPVIVIAMLPYMLSKIVFESTEDIRQNIRNRGLEKEFEEWLKTKKK